MLERSLLARPTLRNSASARIPITLFTASHVTRTTNPAQREEAAGERRSPWPCAWCPSRMAPTLAAACAILRAGITCLVSAQVSGAYRETAVTHGFHP